MYATQTGHTMSVICMLLSLANLSFRAKRGISPSITHHSNYEILRYAQDDNLYDFHRLGSRPQACMRD